MKFVDDKYTIEKVSYTIDKNIHNFEEGKKHGKNRGRKLNDESKWYLRKNLCGCRFLFKLQTDSIPLQSSWNDEKQKVYAKKEQKLLHFPPKTLPEHKLHACLIAIICWICALSLVNKTIGVQMFLNDSVSLSLNISVYTRFCLFARFLHKKWFCFCWFPASGGCSLWK